MNKSKSNRICCTAAEAKKFYATMGIRIEDETTGKEDLLRLARTSLGSVSEDFPDLGDEECVHYFADGSCLGKKKSDSLAEDFDPNYLTMVERALEAA